jgi:TolB-like protein/Tfp pilus assembly protein PilF
MGASLETARRIKSGIEPAKIGPNCGQPPEAVRSELENILGSQAFRTTRAHANFLRYVVEETLAGRGDQIKEYSIGVEVFGRGASFDPRVNNIVRAEANRLRARLAKYYDTEGAQGAIRIELPRGGYTPRFVEAPAFVSAAERPVEPGAPPARFRILRSKIAAVLLLVLLVAAFSIAFWRLRAASAGAGVKPSIAVLPFLNLGGNKDDEFFSDGLTDELIDSLGTVPRLQVVARTSAFQFKGKTLDVREIGRKLSVRTVLEGTVRKYGDRLRITAQLDDTSTGYRLWSGSYDRQASDALAIQREISQAITSELGIALAGGGSPRGNGSGSLAESVAPQAYENYLKGVYFWNRNTPASINTAIGYLNQAIQNDPVFALPYLGLARCYTGLSVMTATPATEVIPKLRGSAQKALELDPSLGEAHVDLAEAYTFDFDWTAAEAEFRKALALSPGSTVAHRWYAYYLTKMGRLDEAMAENKRALELDPVSPYMAQGIADSLYALRRYREAIEQSQKVLALDPNFAMTRQSLGMTLIANGQYSEGISQLKLARQLMGSDPWLDGQLAYSYALSGQTGTARQILNELLRQSQSGGVPALAIAEGYIGLNDRDRAFQWLEKAVSNRELHLGLKTDPIYDTLRTDRRFGILLHRMKLL